MADFELMKSQTLKFREIVTKVLTADAEAAEIVPDGWNNNLRWHAGHLVTTPYLLTYGVMGEELPIPHRYRVWFGKGSSPKEWKAVESMPSHADLVAEIVPTMSKIFDAFGDRMNETYPEVYVTSAGVPLATPGEALNFSFAHDGIHLGLGLALKRAL